MAGRARERFGMEQAAERFKENGLSRFSIGD
jgi:hypothetical protein